MPDPPRLPPPESPVSWGERVAIPAAGELHLWFGSLLPPEDRRKWREETAAILTADERIRIARGLDAAIRDRSLASRATLRRLLALYLGEEPARVPIERGTNGRPTVPDSPFDFNLAHAGDSLVIAVARPGPVGVDLERETRFDGMREIALARFAPAEAAAMLGADDDRLPGLFHRAWVRLEARLKASGAGLTGDAAGSGEMHLLDFELPGGFHGAVALPGAPAAVSVRLLPPA